MGVVSESQQWLSAVELRSWMAFIRVHRLLDERLGRDLKARNGISRGDYAVMVALSEEPDRTIRMSDLAARALVSPSRLTHQINRLEGAGFVVRRKTQGIRGTYAVLTEAGLRTLEQAAPAHVANVRTHFIDQLGPVGVRQLARLLEPIDATLTAAEGQEGFG
jgi:DNA-binding MarR family transcriptional regulator